MKVKPVVTKKYVFRRKLDGKPIVLDLFDSDNRSEKFRATRKLLFDLHVYEHIYKNNVLVISLSTFGILVYNI